MDVYVLNPITEYRVLPDTVIPSQYLSHQITKTVCPDEFSPATAVLHPATLLASVTLNISSLQGAAGTIPSSAIDARVVKCWYQCGDVIRTLNPNQKLFLPDLLLNDDALVNVDTTAQKNYLKRYDTQQYIDITDNHSWGAHPTFDVRDAETLQPFSVASGTNKQLWFTIHVPLGTPSGDYTGTITILNNGAQVDVINISVTVLPFALSESIIEYSIYYNSKYYPDQYPDGALSWSYRNATQLLKEMISLKNHGITNPQTNQEYFGNESNFAGYMAIRTQAGLSNNRIFFHAYWGFNPTANQTTLQSELTTMRNYLMNNWGTTEVYFYLTPDENWFTTAIRDRITWAHQVGVKAYGAAGVADALNYADIVDFINQYSTPNPSVSAAYHAHNNLVSNYSNPQVGEEKPLKYRRNYGFLLWQNNVDAAMDYSSSYGYSILWDDWLFGGNPGDPCLWKQHVFMLPTRTGIVETIAYEGFREATNDIRYLATLIQRIAEAPNSSEKVNAQAYIQWLKTVDLTTLDLDAVRQQIITHTLNLFPSCPEGIDDCVSFTIDTISDHPVGDFIAGSLSYPANVTPGVPFQITYQIENKGTAGIIWTGLFDYATPPNLIQGQYWSGTVIPGSFVQVTLTVTITDAAEFQIFVGHEE